EICIAGGRLVRYYRSAWVTLGWLFRWHGRTVVVQSPSIVLVAQALLLRPLLRYRLIVDAHNAGVLPEYGSVLLNKLIRWSLVQADYVIVTNTGLADYVVALGG